MGLALSFYIAQYSSVFSHEENNQNIAETTLERVWADIENQGTYNYVTSPGDGERYQYIRDALQLRLLPEVSAIYIRISYVEENGQIATVDSLMVTKTRDLRAHPETLPEETKIATRPIGIRYGTRDVRGGTLQVGVKE
jgi:hypothetical protein